MGVSLNYILIMVHSYNNHTKILSVLKELTISDMIYRNAVKMLRSYSVALYQRCVN